MSVKTLTGAVGLTAHMATPQTAQMIAFYSGPGGATAVNVMALWTVGGDFDQETMDDIGSAWSDFYSTFASDEWSVSTAYEFRDLSVDPADVLISNSDGATGGDSSDPLPPASAVVISLHGLGGGRSGRGRIYLPGVPDSSVNTAGQLDSGFADSVVDDYLAWGLAISAMGWVPAVYSRTLNASRIVGTATVDVNLDTQRRRQQRLAP